MCWSASFSEPMMGLVWGVAMWSVDLQLDHVVLDHDREGVDRFVGGKGQRLSGPQIEERAVARAFDGALRAIELALGQRTVVVRAAVLDGEQLATAVEHPDLQVLPFHDARGTGGKVRERADLDEFCGQGEDVRGKSDGDGLNCIERDRRPPAWALW